MSERETGLSPEELKLYQEGKLFISWKDDYVDVSKMYEISQEEKEKHKKILEELIKETPSTNFTLSHYKAKVSSENIEKIKEKKYEERRQEIARQEVWREFSSCLLQFFCSVIAPFLLMGLLAFIAVYFF